MGLSGSTLLDVRAALGVAGHETFLFMGLSEVSLWSGTRVGNLFWPD